MVLKTFAIALDLKRTGTSRNVEVIEGDNGNVLEVTLTDDGVAVDLTDCLVMAVFSKPDGTTAEQDTDGHGVTLDDEVNNKLYIELYTGSMSAGTVNVEIQVYSGVDHTTLVTTAWFNFKCRKGIANADTIPATAEWPILVDMMERCEDVEDAEALRVTAETARLGAETARIALYNKYKNPSASATGLAAGADPTASVTEGESNVAFAFGIPAGAQGIQGIQGIQGVQGERGIQGETGATGNGIASIVRTSGTGAAGTTDTYTIVYTSGANSTFSVYNGADGEGAGDMLASVYAESAGVVKDSAKLNGQAASFYATDSDLTSHTGNAEIHAPIVPTTAELTVVGWSSSAQTVTVSGVTASNTIIVAPDPTDFDAYVAAKIKVTGQGTNSISFSCGTVPTVAITVNVLIVG